MHHAPFLLVLNETNGFRSVQISSTSACIDRNTCADPSNARPARSDACNLGWSASLPLQYSYYRSYSATPPHVRQSASDTSALYLYLVLARG